MVGQAYKQPKTEQFESRENIFTPKIQVYQQGEPGFVGLSLSLQNQTKLLLSAQNQSANAALRMFSDIPWGKITKIRASQEDAAFSFQFDIRGKRQIMTIKAEPDATQFILSKQDGNPLAQATQKGGEITIIDFSAADKLKQMGKISKT